MESELISIIVPVYNVEMFLKKCVESIINQTYRNLDIILVDDGSTDSSGRLCDAWKALDNRIKSENEFMDYANNRWLSKESRTKAKEMFKNKEKYSDILIPPLSLVPALNYLDDKYHKFYKHDSNLFIDTVHNNFHKNN